MLFRSGFQHGGEAGQVATIAKLARVAAMAPVVIAVGLIRARGAAADERPPFPWFVVGFLALVALGGLVPVPAPALDAIGVITTVLFTVALGAMGLMVDLGTLVREGWRPMALGAISWLFVSGVALLLVELLARSVP